MNPNSYDYDYWAEKTKGRIVRALAKEYAMKDLNQKLEAQPNYLFERMVLTRLEDIAKQQKNNERLVRYWMKKTQEGYDQLLAKVEESMRMTERKVTTVKPADFCDKIQITGPLLPRETPNRRVVDISPEKSNGPTWDDVMEEMVAKRSQLKKVVK